MQLVPKQTKAIGFASILTIGEDAMPKGKKHHGKGKGKKRAGVAVGIHRGGCPALYACEASFIQGCSSQGNGTQLEGHQCHPALRPVCKPMLPLVATTGHLQSHAGQPVCSNIGQGAGHQRLPCQMASYHGHAGG